MVGFDTETTGVDVGEDRIVTAALLRYDADGSGRASGAREPAGAAPVERTWLLDPGVEIPATASAIHGVTTERARAEGRPPREALEEIAATLAEELGSGVPVVAFNAAFDLTILERELERWGLPTLRTRLGGEPAPVIDPLVVDRAVDRFRRGKRTLTDLCRHYGVEGEGLHTAEVDVAATIEVLRAIVAAHTHLTEMDLEALHRWQAEQHRQWAEDFNQWRSRRGLPGPGASRHWPVGTGD